MVGTLVKMIASPAVNKKPHQETIRDTKYPPRKSPVQVTPNTPEANQQGISAYPADNDKKDVGYQDGDIENKEAKATYEDAIHEDHVDEELTDNSISFQCSCKVWTCSQCNKAFNSARALKIHEVKQHENMPKRYTKCSHCDEVFDHGNLLQIHLKVHHNIKVQCPQCKDQPKALNTKTQNQEPMCPVCGVKFDHDKLLKLHMEHYHKVSGKDTLSSATLVSSTTKPTSESPEMRELSSELCRGTPSPRLPEDRFTRPSLFYEPNSEESSLRKSASPREVHLENHEPDRHERERFPSDQLYDSGLYQQRPIMSTMPSHNAFYLSRHDESIPPYGVMNMYPRGVRHHLEKRPLGRSQSLPLKQESGYPEAPPLPWQVPNGGNPMLFGVPRDKKIDRAALEAVRNSLKEKLRSVEATLQRDEAESHQPLSPTVSELYEHQRYFHGRDEDFSRPYRPSVITPRSPFGGFTFKHKAPPSDTEPIEKMRALEKNSDALHDSGESRSPRHPMSAFGLSPREGSVTGSYNPHNIPKVSRDDLSIPNMQQDCSFDDQTKIFIKRGAPRCNRCQQTFSSKMEYLHHLISHREKDGLTDASPEEMKFIEDVKRSIEVKNLSSHETVDIPFTKTLANSPGGTSPPIQSALEGAEKNPEPKPESIPEDGSSPEPPLNPDALSLGTQTCTECNDVFADIASYRAHIEKRHTKPKCRECGLTFDHKNLLKIHMDCYHSNLEVLQCYYCGMSFKQRSAFLDHVTSHEAQDIKNKDRTMEQSSDSSETGGRRRWGRLVASAQLPTDKLELGDKEHLYQENLLRDTLSHKSHAKTKLRKTVSLSAYTDMINRQRRSAAELLHESRSKGDEAIGKEMRTRIFLPSFEDKMENLSRFAASSAQLAKKRVSPPPLKANPTAHDNNDHLFQRRSLCPNQDAERQFYRAEDRSPLCEDRSSYPLSGYHVEKRKLMRLKRSAPVDEDDANNAFPPIKAFVRDEVENLYQMRHKNEFGPNPEAKMSPLAEPVDHRNALVKIERVEVDPSLRQVRSEKSEAKERRTSPLVKYQPSDPDSDVNAKPHHTQPAVSTVVPPPLIDVRRVTQASTQSSAVSTASSPTSSRPESPVVSSQSHEYKTKPKPGMDPSSSPVGEMNERESKGKYRNSIKKLTKEALINSLSLKRRASAPDLFQYNRNSTESASDEKIKKYDANTKPNSPTIGSEGTASPPLDNKHHGSRSLYYTPRRQSERDATCTQCGLSFGHKKLYKIHIDSYHGKQQVHECLQCGSKNFRDKDEFVKHLMAHQNEADKVNAASIQKSTAGDQEARSQQDSTREPSHVNGPQSNSQDMKTNRGEEGNVVNSSQELNRLSPQSSSTEKSNTLAKKESLQTAQLNNNANDSIDKKTTCFTCGKSFDNGKQLEQHFSSHASISEDGRFCCVLCGKAFDTHRKLEVHSRSHTGFKPHKCEQCGRCFPYYSSYYYHKMTHTKDRPHKCPICGKGFIQTRYLRSHLSTHKDEHGSHSDEVESIIRKAELNMNDETDEESVDSPSTTECSPASYRANDEEAVTAEILCSFKRGLNCGAQNSDPESPALSNCSNTAEL